MAELVHIEELLERRPEQLSGGQQQRVALARALVRKPGALLLDEPLANLDAKLRLEMRSEIRRVQKETGISAVLVTHDQVEAMSMSDRIAIMKDGNILQVAPPTEMYQRPENDFIAGFLGNPPIAFLDGVVADGIVEISSAEIKIPLPENIEVPPTESRIRVGIRPEFYQPENPYKIPGTVSFVEIQGRENLYDIQLKDGNLLRSIQSATVSPLSPGTKVDWGVRPEQLLFFNSSGKRL
jgi:inositol-phosphate transport system ATP-binding protein